MLAFPLLNQVQPLVVSVEAKRWSFRTFLSRARELVRRAGLRGKAVGTGQPGCRHICSLLFQGRAMRELRKTIWRIQ